MSRGITPSRKFSYQSPFLPTNDIHVIAQEFLQLAPQLLSFIAGSMPLILFDIDRIPEEGGISSSMRQHRLDAEGVFNRLVKDQRPQLKFVATPDDIKCLAKTKVAQVTPMDCMDNPPKRVRPEDHYKVLSKRSLAFSGIPTPKTTVLDVKLD